MDCQTARLLLPFFDARADQVPAEITDAYEAHASQCASCGLLRRDEAREDRLIAVAMKDVQIPDGLRARLVTGLRRERARQRRRWPVRHPRWSAVAAALVLCLAGSLGYWLQKPPPPLDISALAAADSLQGQYQVEALLLEHGRREPPPKQFRYDLLVSSGMEQIQGKLVPRLRFEGKEGQFAEVFILTSRDFDLASSEPVSGNFQLVPDETNPKKVAYLVRYGGGQPDWLFLKRQPGGA